MTTPPPADNDSDEPQPPTGWASPGAPPPAAPVPVGPPAQAPPHAHGPQPPAAPARTNRLAIAALVTGLCGLILVAVGFAIAALVQTGRRGEKGKGLAIGALVASAVWTVAGVVVVAAVLVSLITAERDDSGQVTESNKVLPAVLRVGDCFTGFRGDEMTRLVTALPCAQPHDGEVVAKLRLSGDEYPGDEEISIQASDACDVRTVHLQKSRYVKDLEPYNISPTRMTWSDGDREVICLLRYTGPGTLTSPLAETMDPSLRMWYELTPGDCLKKWDDTSWIQRTVSCTKPHWIQVYATFNLKAGTYPGMRATERKAEHGCNQRWKKDFRGHRTPDLISWVYPEEDEWEGGHRKVACLGESEDRPMKRSLLPR